MVLHTVGPAEKLPPDHGGLLVVDDEQFLRDAVAASLRFLGFEVTTAETAAEALRLARDRPFNLVVLDVMLLWLARLDQHPARQSDPVDLSALAANCVERSQIADPRRTWQARITPGLVAVGDQEMLCRAVDNLLANVRTHTPEGSTAVVTGYAEGDRVVVEVSDNGPGVPADRLPRIFDASTARAPRPSVPGPASGSPSSPRSPRPTTAPSRPRPPGHGGCASPSPCPPGSRPAQRTPGGPTGRPTGVRPRGRKS